jgi:hypothetical protein
VKHRRKKQFQSYKTILKRIVKNNMALAHISQQELDHYETFGTFSRETIEAELLRISEPEAKVTFENQYYF